MVNGNCSILQQFTYQLSKLLHQFMVLLNSQTIDVSNQLPSTSNQSPDTNGDKELSEAYVGVGTGGRGWWYSPPPII